MDRAGRPPEHAMTNEPVTRQPGADRPQNPAGRPPNDAGPVEIRPLESREDFEACVRLQQATWGETFSERVPSPSSSPSRSWAVSSQACSIPRAGCWASSSAGWQNESPHDWSDKLAVAHEARDRRIGEALEWHQRKLLLERNIKNVEWTSEPLEARNAWLAGTD